MYRYKSLAFYLIGLFLFESVLCDYYKNDNQHFYRNSLHRELTKNQFDHVQLNHQNISQITKDLLWELTMVEKLEIEHSNVCSIERGSFERLIKLKKLSLKHNLLEEIKNNVFSLASVEELDLSDNQIRSIEAYAFHDMWNLQSINLKDNKIEVYNSEWFRYNRKICSINLEHNLIKTLSVNIAKFWWFKPSCNIDFILSHNRIGEISEEAFPYAWTFNKLYLDHNAITTIKNKTFSKVSVIKDLRLDHNQITCTAADIKLVDKINVDGNPWNQQCLLEFLEPKIINPVPTSTSLPSVRLTTHLNYFRFG